MKLFGLEIKRDNQTHAQPNPGVPSAGPNPASIEKANQKTLPSLPLASSYPKADLGDSGTRMLHGIITEEYNSQLQGVQGIRIYDEMRKSDGTVRAAILVTTLPIRRAQWFVNPANEDQESKNIANFVEHALFDWLEDMTWDDVIRQALLMVAFGVMLFEKVYTIKNADGKDWVTLQKLAPRLPKSILQWELPDRTFGIQQIRQDGVLANIPGSKLLIFVNEREGDNWWGTSMLRAAYKHWYYKNNFYKIDAVAFERQGLGIPKITMPQGYTENDERKAVQAMQNLRANENAFLLLPPNYAAEFMNMGSSTTRDPQNSIEHHNKEILQSVLAQFLELGATKSGSGSRALSQDHSDLFLKAEEAIANTIIGVINKDLIPELVDLNFDNVKTYPVLDYSGITKVDMAALGEAYSNLVTAGAITPTDDDQQYIRAALGLPPRSQEDIEAAANGDPSMEEQADHVDIEDTGEADPAGPPADPNADPKAKVDKAATQAKKPKQTPKQNAQVDKAATDKKKASELKKKFGDGKGFQSWRPLTFAEKKVSWANIEDAMSSMEDDFTASAQELLGQAKDQFMAELHKALTDGDTKAVAALEVAFESQYKTLLKDAMKKAYEYGKTNVGTEIGVATPPNSADSLANIDLLADTIAAKTMGDIEAKAKLSATTALKQDTPTLQASGSIDSNLEEVIDKAVDNTAGTIIAQSINNGRNDVFQRNADKIQSIMRSEILDDVTCNFCLSADGLVFGIDDPWATVDIFHTNCRGINVAILNDEQDPPEETGVPSEVSQHWGGEVNSLVQPKKPIENANSQLPADDQK